MKKMLFGVLCMCTVLALSGCFSQGEEAGAETKANETEAVQKQPGATNPKAHPAATTSQKTPEKPTTKPDPTKLDFSNPLTPDQLNDAIYAWTGKEVALLGYCDSIFKDFAFNMDISLLADPVSKEKLVHCQVAKKSNDRHPKTSRVVVKGVVDGMWGDEIKLVKAELVSVDYSGETGEANPSAIDINKPIPVEDFHKSYNFCEGKEFTVTGKWDGTTKSKLKSGDVIRVDLKGPTGKTKVGCHVSTDPGKLSGQITMKGVFQERSYNGVNLKNCEIVR